MNKLQIQMDRINKNRFISSTYMYILYIINSETSLNCLTRAQYRDPE